MQIETDTLSPHHLRVLSLYSNGVKRREIAEKFNRSDRTIENYFDDIRSAFGVNSMTHAVAIALRLNIIK